MGQIGQRRSRRCIPARQLRPLPESLPVHTLTRIYSMEYTERVEPAFDIIAEPNRRAILSLL